MSYHRPHTQTVRLTESQHVLTRRRMVEEGMSWQRLLSACVNAYARDELHVGPSGDLSLGALRESSSTRSARAEAGPTVTTGDDPDAIDLDDLMDLPDEGDPPALPDEHGRPYGSQEPRTIGTRELANLAEERTGRRVNLVLLRELVRERYPQDAEPGPSTRYRWDIEDPQVEQIIDDIGQGALNEIRDRRLLETMLDE